MRDTVIYDYDKLGRLRQSIGRQYRESFSYDRNSNVTAISRDLTGLPAARTTLTYDGNQLCNIAEDAPDILAGEIAKIPRGCYSDAMAYDDNGRMTRDDSRRISKVTYTDWGNYPSVIKIDSCYSIYFDYGPDGINRRTLERQRVLKAFNKVNSAGDTVVINRYVAEDVSRRYYGAFEQHSAAGWIYRLGSAYYSFSDKRMHYVATDNLGSTRVVYADKDIPEQQTAYYPSGLPISLTPQTATNRLHIGNEYLNLGGIGYYNNTARLHDPVLASFHTPDALGHQYSHLGNYTHCASNPVNAIDRDGNLVIYVNGLAADGTGGKEEYWGEIPSVLERKFHDPKRIFFNGSDWIWSRADNRYDDGYKNGYESAASIISALDADETIKVITHSMGSAHGRGVINGLRQYASDNNLTNKINIQMVVDIAPYQADKLQPIDEPTPNVILHNGDWLSDKIPNSEQNNFIKINSSIPVKWTLFGAHTIKTFLTDLIDIVNRELSNH